MNPLLPKCKDCGRDCGLRGQKIAWFMADGIFCDKCMGDGYYRVAMRNLDFESNKFRKEHPY